MKKILFFVLILIGIFSLFVYFLYPQKENEQNSVKVSGNIEATEVNVGFNISGRITHIYVKEGDWVEKGSLIAKLDDKDLRYRFELAKAGLNSTQARLNKLLAGSRPEEIREAEARLNQAKYELENKRIQYERMKGLFEKHVIPKEVLDNAETGYRVSQEFFEMAKENYKLVKEGPRKEDIEEAKAQLEQARAQLKLAEIQLSYTNLYSPISGIVLVKSCEVGEVVNQGASILTMADIENVWLRAYIPETELGKIKWGQEVIVKTDMTPKKEYKGRISYISSQAEFTPKSIQTEKERVTLVYRIKVDIKNVDKELKPGMPAEGIILLNSIPQK